MTQELATSYTQGIRVPIDMLVENTDNPRTITEEKMQKLANSIIEFPSMLQYRPLICVTVKDEADIALYGKKMLKTSFMPLGGNMRRQALLLVRKILESKEARTIEEEKTLMMVNTAVPIMLADEWTLQQREEFVIKDNLSYGQWDWDMVANRWEKPVLEGWGMDIPDFKRPANIETSEDNYNTTPPTIPQTITGDIYEMNGHRLACADSENRFHISALMAGQRANLCMTSPPYWVGKDYEKEKTEEAIEKFISDVAAGISLAVDPDFGRVVINTGTASINRIDRKRKVEILILVDKWAAALRGEGWLMRHLRIWVKRGQLPATISPKTDVIDQHNEYIATFEREYSQVATFWNPEGEQRGMQRLGTPWAQQGVWDDVHGEKSTRGRHNAAFPVEIPARNILLYTRPNEIVFEPFCGAGTTIIASEQTYRKCYAQEMSPGYCDVSVRRWVAWMKLSNKPFTVLRNGKDITNDAWLHEEMN